MFLFNHYLFIKFYWKSRRIKIPLNFLYR